MKVKVLLLSMTMLLSFIGSSVFSLKGDDSRAVKYEGPRAEGRSLQHMRP